MCGLLGYELDDFLGKELWEIGLFRDKEASRDAYRELLAKGYIRYEHLPLRTKGGEEVEVEFVSNLYMVGDRQVAQCNIRDITQRSRMERQAKAQAAALADLHRRKDEFLAMLSHELRNPLSPDPQRRAPAPPPRGREPDPAGGPHASSSGRWGSSPTSSTT